ncbi:hypothetical protein LTR09_000077 [Extremus antarcticus]|uniref:Pyrroline-5-carboxylate reductase n=1 Tax=Extremus antarcticus TaxID=702011 RepID=A0AAJ0LWU8_9PEZI|nr:hypothetical protein LTR09_000077 [Extremus antarcticus]
MAEPPQSLQVAILGCGSMGTSLLEGFLRKQTSSRPLSLRLAGCTRSQPSIDRVRQRLGDQADRVELGYGDASGEMAEKSEIVILGCPKEDLTAALKTTKPGPRFADKTIVSLMAGLSADQLQKELTSSGAPQNTAIVIVIPSFAARTGGSVSLLASPSTVSQERIDIVTQLFEQVGSVLHVDEGLLMKGVAIGAACHALAVTAVDSIADAGVCEGVPRPLAGAFAAQFLRSAAGAMVDGMSPEQLKAALSTPKGITLNAVVDLDKAGARGAVIGAARGAVRYAESM